MRRKLVAAFLCGLVIPLALAGLVPRGQAAREVPDRESEGLSREETTPQVLDRQIRLTVQTASGNLKQMTLEEYLTGVVLAEMPVSFETEALRAQAVVARTYTRKRLEGSKHGAAAVCTEANCCQGFRTEQEHMDRGGTTQQVERVRQCVADTDGEVLIYEGELIDATYFSCSGGSTEDAVAVWGRDVPYLQAVESPGEEDAPRYEQRVSFTPENFKVMTGCAGHGDPADWFGGVRYTEGDGVETMEICGETFTGTQLRQMLGLRSTKFTIGVEDGYIVVTTLGFGHRVGMSQYGAQAMALEGYGYQEILRHYYTGAWVGTKEG